MQLFGPVVNPRALGHACLIITQTDSFSVPSRRIYSHDVVHFTAVRVQQNRAWNMTYQYVPRNWFGSIPTPDCHSPEHRSRINSIFHCMWFNRRMSITFERFWFWFFYSMVFFLSFSTLAGTFQVISCCLWVVMSGKRLWAAEVKENAHDLRSRYLIYHKYEMKSTRPKAWVRLVGDMFVFQRLLWPWEQTREHLKGAEDLTRGKLAAITCQWQCLSGILSFPSACLLGQLCCTRWEKSLWCEHLKSNDWNPVHANGEPWELKNGLLCAARFRSDRPLPLYSSCSSWVSVWPDLGVIKWGPFMNESSPRPGSSDDRLWRELAHCAHTNAQVGAGNPAWPDCGKPTKTSFSMTINY